MVKIASQIIINKEKKSWLLPLNSFRILIIILLILGIFFRFVNLDKKVYWNDETFTSLRISGYTESQVLIKIFNGQIISKEDLQKFQKSNAQKSWIDTIKTLALDDPHHPPLYYIMVRYWGQHFGNSIAAMRSFSAVISLLVFPGIYWLCKELFNSSLTGWLAIILIAVSPFHVLYAQEAREYTILIVMTLLSSSSLLRARRLNTKLNWVIYAITLIIGLYINLFFVLLISGHSIYIFVNERFKFNKKITAYSIALLTAILAFLPWMLSFFNHYSVVNQSTAWTHGKIPLFSLLRFWAFNISYTFFDLQTSDVWQPIQSIKRNLYLYLLIILTLALIGYAIYFLCKQTNKQTWSFVIILMASSTLPLIIPDLLLGGLRSIVPRYLIPFYLSIHLAVAFLISIKITDTAAHKQQQKFWKMVLIILLSGGILSCSVSSQAENWWTKYQSYYNPDIAKVINTGKRPLVVSDSSIGSVISLSYLLDSKVNFQLILKQSVPKIPEGYSDIFFFNPYGFSKQLKSELQKKYQINLIYQCKNLWSSLWKLESQLSRVRQS